MHVLAAIVAVVLAVFGVVDIAQGEVLWGLILIVAACAIGPGGWTIWGNRG